MVSPFGGFTMAGRVVVVTTDTVVRGTVATVLVAAGAVVFPLHAPIITMHRPSKVFLIREWYLSK
jgi:hypothetical protein